MKLAAAHFDNWVFLLLVAVAMFFRWLTSVANKASKGSDDADESDTPPPVPRAPTPTDEERIRKFLEALGQPVGTKPPPPVAPRPMDAERAAREARQRMEQTKRAAESRRKVFAPRPNLPPLTTFPPPVPAESLTTAEEPPSLPKSTSREGTIFEVHGSPPLPSNIRATTSANADIMALLKSPSGLRNAIVLREVFGPPRSMQPMDLV